MVGRGWLFSNEELFGLPIIFHRSNLFFKIGPVAFIIVGRLRHLYVGLFVVGEAQRVCDSHRMGASRAATAKDVHRRVPVVTHNGRQYVPTGLFRYQDVQAAYIRRQLLRGVFRGDLLNEAGLVRFVRVSGRGTVRVRLHIPFPARVGTVHVMHLWDEEGGRSTGDQFPVYL